MSTDQLAKSQGKEVVFGLGQIAHPTPAVAKWVFRVILYLSALWTVIAPSVTELPPETLATITKYLLLAVTVVNITIKFFGWDYKQD